MNEFIAVAIITILAVISPGADFAIVTKNSYLYGRKTGILTATGIAMGVLIHVTYTLIAVYFVMAYTPNLLTIIKYIGALYLIYIGYKTFTQKPVHDVDNMNVITTWQALRYGFFTNALNPKTTLFVISTYTQIVNPDTSFSVLIGYGLFMLLAHFIWFSLISGLFSHQRLRAKMLSKQVLINRVIGCVLVILGILLFSSNL